MDVRLPDGTIVRGVPEGTTQPELLRRLKAGGYDVRKLVPTPPIAGGVDPMAGMSRTDRFLAGAGKALSDTASGLKQRLDEGAAALEGLIPGGEAVSRAFGGRSAREIRDAGQAEIADTRRRDAPLMRDPWAIGGNVAGQAAALAPVAPLGAVGSGVAAGFSQPTVDGAGEVLANMAMGGASGWAGDRVVRGVSRVVQPRTRPEVRALMDEGITPTPGQIAGGMANRIEEKATSLPFVGDMIASSRRRAGAELNRAAFNRALAPVGQRLPQGLQGREAVQYVDDVLGQHYDALLPRLTVRADPTFATELQSLRGMVSTGSIDPRLANTFERIVQNDVLAKFRGQQALTGPTVKAIESDLGQQIARFGASTDADGRLMADALQEVQAQLRRLVERSNPQAARELRAINTGWANFKRVQRAASYVGADEGIFTPAQLQSAVKALDRSKDKGRFARGGALMQDLSDPARSVLGQAYPDSGTAGRLMNAGALLSGLHTPAVPAAFAAAAPLYSAPAQRALAAAMTRRPAWAPLVAEEIESVAPLLGLMGASGAMSQR